MDTDQFSALSSADVGCRSHSDGGSSPCGLLYILHVQKMLWQEEEIEKRSGEKESRAKKNRRGLRRGRRRTKGNQNLI